MPTPQTTSLSPWKKATATAVTILLTGSLIHLIFEAAGGHYDPLTPKFAPLFGGMIMVCIMITGSINGYWKNWHPIWIGSFWIALGVTYSFVYWMIAHAGYMFVFVSIPLFFVQLIFEGIVTGVKFATFVTCLVFLVLSTYLELALFSASPRHFLGWTDFLPSLYAIYPATSLQISFFAIHEDKGKTFPPGSPNIDDHF